MEHSYARMSSLRADPASRMHTLVLAAAGYSGTRDWELFTLHIRTMTHESPCFLDPHHFTVFGQQMC